MDITDELCEQILEYSWREGIRILESNGGKMKLRVFYETLRKNTAEKFNIPNSHTADWLVRPAYWNLPVEVEVGGPMGGESIGTIELLENKEPTYKDDYVPYIAANLRKL